MKFVEALPHLEAAYGYRRHSVKYSNELTKVLFRLNKHAEARPILVEQLKLIPNDSQASLQILILRAETLLRLAKVEIFVNRSPERFTHFDQAINLYRRLSLVHLITFGPHLCDALSSLAWELEHEEYARFLNGEKVEPKSLKLMTEELEITRSWEQNVPNSSRIRSATVASRLATLAAQFGETKLALQNLRRALCDWESVVRGDASQYNLWMYSELLVEAGGIFGNAQQFSEAHAAFRGALSILARPDSANQGWDGLQQIKALRMWILVCAGWRQEKELQEALPLVFEYAAGITIRYPGTEVAELAIGGIAEVFRMTSQRREACTFIEDGHRASSITQSRAASPRSLATIALVNKNPVSQ